MSQLWRRIKPCNKCNPASGSKFNCITANFDGTQHGIYILCSGFLLKPSHGGFGNFFPLVPMQEKYNVCRVWKCYEKSHEKKNNNVSMIFKKVLFNDFHSMLLSSLIFSQPKKYLFLTGKLRTSLKDNFR